MVNPSRSVSDGHSGWIDGRQTIEIDVVEKIRNRLYIDEFISNGPSGLILETHQQ
jgi:hypothetical protein